MPRHISAELRAAVRDRRPALDELSLALHAHPETRFEEYRAAKLITARL
jgi:metal-dependent amidase/aminoacylase/carboxypeptidase family protein